MAIELTAEQLAAYKRDGYIVVEDVLTLPEVEELRSRLREYTHGGRPWGDLRVQVEPRIQRGEMSVAHPGDGIRKIELLVENDDLFRGLGLHANMVGVVEQSNDLRETVRQPQFAGCCYSRFADERRLVAQCSAYNLLTLTMGELTNQCADCRT